MPWYVRYGPGKVAPRPTDAPRLRRGWVMVANISKAAALKIGAKKTAAGLSAEAGEMFGEKRRARYSPAAFREGVEPDA